MVTADLSVLAGLRLLVVEDEYMIAEHISMLLEDLGCDVAGPVATIEEALAMLEGGGLDGALLDANLNVVYSRLRLARRKLEAFIDARTHGARHRRVP